MNFSFSIPAATPERQKAVEQLAARVLAAKHRDAGEDTSALGRESHPLVDALHGLTPEEIQLVEGATQ